MRLKTLVLVGNGIILGALAIAQIVGDLDCVFMILLVPVALNIILVALWL